MIVSIIGSKDQLVNEYRVMLAEKLLNKTDYDIDSEIRTLELLKVRDLELNWEIEFLLVVVYFYLCSSSCYLKFSRFQYCILMFSSGVLVPDTFWRKQYAEV